MCTFWSYINAAELNSLQYLPSSTMLWKWSKRLTHFVESFCWWCDCGFGYPQAFLPCHVPWGKFYLNMLAETFPVQMKDYKWQWGRPYLLIYIHLIYKDWGNLASLESRCKNSQTSDFQDFYFREYLIFNQIYTVWGSPSSSTMKSPHQRYLCR